MPAFYSDFFTPIDNRLKIDDTLGKAFCRVQTDFLDQMSKLNESKYKGSSEGEYYGNCKSRQKQND